MNDFAGSLRYDHVDKGGKVSIRRAGCMHHLGIGTAHAGTEILAITDTASVTWREPRVHSGSAPLGFVVSVPV